MGSHGWAFGGELRKEQDNNDLLGGARPLYTFGGLFNFANGTPLFYQIDADPRTGGPPDTQRHFRAHTLAFFAQDDWKYKPNLTINLGLRWEYAGPLRQMIKISMRTTIWAACSSDHVVTIKLCRSFNMPPRSNLTTGRSLPAFHGAGPRDTRAQLL